MDEFCGMELYLNKVAFIKLLLSDKLLSKYLFKFFLKY